MNCPVCGAEMVRKNMGRYGKVLWCPRCNMGLGTLTHIAQALKLKEAES